MPFSGFNDDDERTGLPETFFRELLPGIDDVHELKLVLYVLWRVTKQARVFPFIKKSELLEDVIFMQGLGPEPAAQHRALDDALSRAEQRGVLLSAGEAVSRIYILNTPQGRAAQQGLAQGKWNPDAFAAQTVVLGEVRPNIFELYEQNIGPLTPMLAESLREAEAEYPYEWIEDAVRIALENNVRKWRYVEAILKSWQEKGRDDRKDQQNSESDRRKYVEGEFSDFIER